jgi:uncharacterized repeat protein (TIGR03806 family)
MFRSFRLGLVIFLACWSIGSMDAAVAEEKAPVRRPYGIEKRIPWTTSRVHGRPGPEDPYRTEVVFPALKFSEPLEMAALPGTNRLVVAERRGRIFTFANDPQVARSDLLLDLKRTVYGVVAHPKYAENGYIFVTSMVDETEGAPTGSRVSRFTVTRRQPPQADPASEKVIIEWPAGGHNGGCIRFGPDGYLYLITGDGSGIADQLQTGQTVDDLLAALLRIDVDRQENGRGYAIPGDNPFVGMAGARGEIWAYGLRQFWKYAFDSKTGELWGGEVGQDLWEEVILVTKGGNYGWSVQEGNHPFRPARTVGPTPPLPPVLEHPHSRFRSITGGYVYRGKRLPELAGRYIYADYDSGQIWTLSYDGKKVTESRQLADTQLRIVSFGEDPAGEIYMVDFIGGQIHRLVPAPPQTAEVDNFPRKLSETGLFTSTTDMTPAAGLIPYSVNSPLWSDGAEKERYLALPGNSQIEFETIIYPQPAPGAPPGWRFPPDTVLVKTFSLEIEAGNPSSTRRLETRLLHLKPMPGTDEVGAEFWHGYTYVWNDEQTDAELLDPDGLDRKYTITDPKAPGGKREQVWHFPSRTECSTCHTASAKYALGIDTRQFNKDHDYGGVIANQIATLEHLGVFKNQLPTRPEDLPRLVDHRDATQPLNERARSYLQSNCAHCHRKWGGGNAEFQLLYTLPLAETGTIDIRPGQGTFDLGDPRILVPGDPDRSLILYRMKKLGLGRMPHIASNRVDEEAVAIIEAWIKELRGAAKGE